MLLAKNFLFCQPFIFLYIFINDANEGSASVDEAD